MSVFLKVQQTVATILSTHLDKEEAEWAMV